MGTTAGTAAKSVVDRMGVKPGQLVQELGHGDDVDADLLAEVEQRTGSPLLGPDTDEVVDVAVVWFRDGDGDLTDVLVDTLSSLADDGVVWLLTPKVGRPGHVEPEEVSDAAPTAGLMQSTSLAAGSEWSGVRLVARGAARR